MTDADKHAFRQAFSRLAIALREKEPDAVQMRVYFDGLRDLEVEFIVAACEQLVRSEFFPKVGDWRRAAFGVERERVAAQRQLLRNLSVPLCRECADTGWAPNTDNRVRRCDCQTLRRLEVLGRRPQPALPTASPDVIDVIGAIDQVDAVSLVTAI
jgi:hypothetical protein